MKDNKILCNYQISSDKVMLINNEENVGIKNKIEAIQIAKNQGLDLIQVGIKDNIPVCKPMDYGKIKYQQSKKHKNKETVLKEIRLRIVTDKQDFLLKQKKLDEFLNKGYHVKINIKLQGREVGFKNDAVNKIKDLFLPFLEKIEEPKMSIFDKAVSVHLIPKKK